MAELTTERLKAVLHYDPDTGIFTWLVSLSSRSVAGNEAGTIIHHGYRAINIDGRRYLAHRLAWFYMTGEWPNIIDHRDRDTGNNRFVNLRNGTRRLNNQNLGMRSDNSTGFIGVTKQKRLFAARISNKGKMIHIGSYRTAEEAHEAYQKAKKELHEFAP